MQLRPEVTLDLRSAHSPWGCGQVAEGLYIHLPSQLQDESEFVQTDDYRRMLPRWAYCLATEVQVSLLAPESSGTHIDKGGSLLFLWAQSSHSNMAQ